MNQNFEIKNIVKKIIKYKFNDLTIYGKIRIRYNDKLNFLGNENFDKLTTCIV